MKAYEFKSIQEDHGVFTIVKFYRSPNLGVCHVGYLKVAASDEAAALAVARQAM
jgi:hypothetical protein